MLFYVLLGLLVVTFALELCFEVGAVRLDNPLAVHGLFAALLTALAWVFRRKR